MATEALTEAPLTAWPSNNQPERPKDKWFSEYAKPGDIYPYEAFLPTFDPKERYPPLEPFDHVDPGKKALNDPEPRAFLEGAHVEDLTPRFGSEVSGIQLDQLDDRGKEQLALFVAQRGVVMFRDQDLIDRPADWMVNWTARHGLLFALPTPNNVVQAFFGKPHIHPVSGVPQGFPEIHLIYRSPESSTHFEVPNRLNSISWHAWVCPLDYDLLSKGEHGRDVTYELQPPGLTALFLFDSPAVGGDTAFADQRIAFERLSPSYKAYLETLSVLHSGAAQEAYSRKGKRGGVIRRDSVDTIHPLVRKHPVTGEKALFVNKFFSSHIVGLREEESASILELLYNHIQLGADFQVRVRWKPRSVLLWDNRITAHSAIIDDDNSTRRHGARLTPLAEKPFI